MDAAAAEALGDSGRIFARQHPAWLMLASWENAAKHDQ
jgi:hypothetical protein